MKLLAVLAWIAAMVALPVSAQPVYRCGNTYSQIPCESDARPVRIAPTAAPDRPTGTAPGQALCNATAVQMLGIPDPTTARVSAMKAPAAVIQYAGQPIAVHQYLVRAEGRLFHCFLSEDEHRVLKFVTPGQHAMDSAPPVAAGPAGIATPRPKPMTPYDSLAADRARREAEEGSILRATMRGAQRIDPGPTPRR